ncbi:MAG: insulinase family protein [Marinobacter sp.]|nr:insulinase family protein [Marinobacter sp.]
MYSLSARLFQRKAPATLVLIILFMMALANVAQATTPLRKLAQSASAGAFSAPELYSPTYIRFDNGLQLVVLQRNTARSVSFKVRVGVGMADFDCGRQEIPHALEHMVYGGLLDFSEKALEQRFWELGVDSNAYVAGSETVFEAEVFPSSLSETMSITLRLLTEGHFTEDQWQKTSAIMRQEMGGEPTNLERSSLTGGEFASAMTKLNAAIDRQYNRICPEYDQQQNIGLADIRQTYETYYQPQNMLWVVVGDIDEARVLLWAKKNLATMERRGAVPDQNTPSQELPGQKTWRGYSSDPAAGLLFPTGNAGDPDYFPLIALSNLLDQMAYAQLRIADGTSYSPGAWHYADEHEGWLGITTDTPAGDHEEALERMRGLLSELSAQRLSEGQFERFLRGILRSWARAPESNEGFVDFYLASHWEFKELGRLVHYEKSLASVTPADLQRVASKLSRSELIYELINEEYPEDAY